MYKSDIKNQIFYYGKGNRSKLDFFTISSGLQKSIRRGLVSDSLYYGRELIEAGQANYLIKRLFIILTEDIGVRNPSLGIFFNKKIKEYENSKTETEFDENLLYSIIEQFALSAKNRECDNFLCSYSLSFMENTKSLNEIYTEIVNFYVNSQKNQERRDKGNQILALLRENINVNNKNSNYDFKMKIFSSIFSSKSQKTENFLNELILNRYGKYIDSEILKNYSELIIKGKKYNVGSALILYFAFFELYKDNIDKMPAKIIIEGRKDNNFSIQEEIILQDFVLDKHTYAGRRLGRDFEHFFLEGGFLANEYDFNDYKYKRIIFKNYNLELNV